MTAGPSRTSSKCEPCDLQPLATMTWLDVECRRVEVYGHVLKCSSDCCQHSQESHDNPCQFPEFHCISSNIGILCDGSPRQLPALCGSPLWQPTAQLSNPLQSCQVLPGPARSCLNQVERNCLPQVERHILHILAMAGDNVKSKGAHPTEFSKSEIQTHQLKISQLFSTLQRHSHLNCKHTANILQTWRANNF